VPLLLLPPLSLPPGGEVRRAPSAPAAARTPGSIARRGVFLPTPPPLAPPAPRPPDYSRAYVAAASLWGAGSLALFVGLVGSHGYLLYLRRTATLAGEVAPPPAPVLLTHPRVTVPFAARAQFARPAVFLPADGGASWSAEALPAVLAHECAHLRRRDSDWNLLARVLWALLWPHPFVWLLLRRLEEAQELACDREALSAAGDACRPRAYADCLVDLAERHARPAWERMAGTTAAVSRRSLLEERVRHIMESREEQTHAQASRRVRIAVASGAAVLLGVTLGGFRLMSPSAVLPPIPAPTGGVALAQGPPPITDPMEQPVSFRFQNRPAIDALRDVLGESGLKLVVAPEVRARLTGTVTLQYYAVRRSGFVHSILRRSAREVPLHWVRENDTVRIVPTAVGEDGLPAGTFSLDYPDPAPLEAVLQRLFAGTGAEFSHTGTLRGMTTRVQVKNVRFREALQAILQGASRPFRYGKETSFGPHVTLLDVEEAERIKQRRAAEEAAYLEKVRAGQAELVTFTGPPLPDKRVTVDVTGVPLAKALEAAFNSARQDYSMSNEVTGGAITGRYSDAPLNEVLPAIFRQYPYPLVCSYEKGGTANGVIIIRRRF